MLHLVPIRGRGSTLFLRFVAKTSTALVTAGALEARVHRTSVSGNQLGKPSDVQWIMSTHEGSFVFIIHPTLITVLQLKEELCDMGYVIWTAISHGHIK